MNAVVAFLQVPNTVGIIWPHVVLAVAVILFKLFDVWSTNYIVGRKGGSESPHTLTFLLIRWFGLQIGLAVDFLIVAAVLYFLYPYTVGLLVLLVIQWIATEHQWMEYRKSRP